MAGERETDVVIVGAALAGLVAGAILTRRGNRTSVPRARSVSIALAKAMVNDVAVSQVPAKRALVPRLMFTTFTSGWLVMT